MRSATHSQIGARWIGVRDETKAARSFRDGVFHDDKIYQTSPLRIIFFQHFVIGRSAQTSDEKPHLRKKRWSVHKKNAAAAGRQSKAHDCYTTQYYVATVYVRKHRKN
uniref:Uncharacterized protein n=1 Tax=Romanomermis culicivorax TaxID=13658 RepID=A0A915JL36_ROMCU